MRDPVIKQLKAAFGDPTDTEQGRWSFSRGKLYPLNVIVSNLSNGSAGIAKVWIFDPHTSCEDKVKVLEIAGDGQIEALIQCVRDRMQLRHSALVAGRPLTSER